MEIIKPKSVQNLINKFCYTIGMLPTSYKISLTYEEQILAIGNYLEETVYPAINNNAKALAELQNLFIELKNYVDNYFDNLDVQEEINHKIDEMIQQGTFQEIITSYIQANTAWIFDTVEDLKQAENLINGSYVKTLGFRTINDGGGATYKITNTGEATETDIIQINSLYAHIILPTIVSPEMFGAYGDGEHDDTNAWNKAVNVNRNVKAFEKTYLTGKITITDNISIDCGNASFICNDTTLFEIKGEIITNLANENNYNRNDTDYSIINANYSNYSGVAFIHGDNNFQEDRTYYLGGFMTTFKNGKINNSYPIRVTNPQIDIINPITANLKNINNITHLSNNEEANSIIVLYGFNCLLENINIKNAQCYTSILIEKSLNITMNNLHIIQEIQTSNNNSYIIYIKDSSFCNLLNSYLYNRYWHTYTTGGQYLCYKNIIDKCELFASNAPSIADHRNALGTTILNSTTSGINVSGLSILKNIINSSVREHNAKRCAIAFMPTSIKENGIFEASDIILQPDETSTMCAIILENDTQVKGKTYYFNKITLKNINCNSDTVIAQTSKSSNDNTGTCVINKYFIDNCELEINGLTRGTENNWDISNSDLYLSNLNYDVPSSPSRKSDVGTASSDNFNRLHISNCRNRLVRGNCVDLNLNNFEASATITINVSGKLTGSNIKSNINTSVILGATQVSLTDIIVYGNTKYYNITSNSGHVYYQAIENGEFVTKELTA